jgi:hypothetical protein
MTRCGRYESADNIGRSPGGNGDLVVWVWIGHHAEYDRLVR